MNHAEKTETLADAAWSSVGGLPLMPEERVDSVFDVDRGVADGEREPSEALILTSRRIIHVKGRGGRRHIVFLPLRNVDAIEIMRQPLGYSTFVWAALAVVVAVLVWQVWEYALAPLASLIVIGMGAYLVVDRFLSLQHLYVVVTSGSSQVRLELRSKDASRAHPRLHDPRLPATGGGRHRRPAGPDTVPAPVGGRASPAH